MCFQLDLWYWAWLPSWEVNILNIFIYSPSHLFLCIPCHMCGCQRITWGSGGVISLLPCRSQESNSGHLAWWQVPFSTESSHRPLVFFKNKNSCIIVSVCIMCVDLHAMACVSVLPPLCEFWGWIRIAKLIYPLSDFTSLFLVFSLWFIEWSGASFYYDLVCSCFEAL